MDKRRLVRTSFDRFRDSLSIRGYRDYDAYLQSDEWRQFNQWYKSSHLPQHCLVCRCKTFVLHHWCYDRVGCEELCDVIPLCHQHHHDIHAWEAHDSSRRITNLLDSLISIGMSADLAKQAIKPFLKLRHGTSKRRCAMCRRRISKHHPSPKCWSCGGRTMRGARGKTAAPRISATALKDKKRRKRQEKLFIQRLNTI